MAAVLSDAKCCVSGLCTASAFDEHLPTFVGVVPLDVVVQRYNGIREGAPVAGPASPRLANRARLRIEPALMQRHSFVDELLHGVERFALRRILGAMRRDRKHRRCLLPIRRQETDLPYLAALIPTELTCTLLSAGAECARRL